MWNEKVSDTQGRPGQPEEDRNTSDFWQRGGFLCTMHVTNELDVRHLVWNQKNSKKGDMLNSVINS